ncbi:hypothetical protein BCD64_07305 [Nostoc sp. MBR 210]|nr:hypothetical protein BCD64_07305 [Nostoc sp. MBR 210]
MENRHTLAAMVSIGNRDHLTKHSFRRYYRWASKYGYTSILIKQPLVDQNILPHYNKLLVPYAYPGFDRYVICDDDLFINSNAPELPDIPDGYVGLAKDAVQKNTKADFVKWTGNTGFIVTDKIGSELLYKAYENGDVTDIWPGFADQSALNYVLWKADRIFEIDSRWNYAPILDFFVNHSSGGWELWNTNKLYRLSYYLGIMTGLRFKSLNRLNKAYGVHLIHARYSNFFDFHIP